jgi:hypothetical protein
MPNEIKHLTVIEVDDWMWLFDGEHLVLSQPDIGAFVLADLTAGQPFILNHISADGSQFDRETVEGGDPTTLSEARVKCAAAHSPT